MDVQSANSASIVSTNGFVRTRSGCIVRSKQIGREFRPRQERDVPRANQCAMRIGDAGERSEARREAAPAATAVPVVFIALAIVSKSQGWELLGLPWWVWLFLGAPALLLMIDLLLAIRDHGLVRTRAAALVLLGLLVVGQLRRARNSRRRPRGLQHLRSERGRASPDRVRDLHVGRRGLRPHLLGARGRRAGRAAHTRTARQSSSASRRTMLECVHGSRTRGITSTFP